MYGDVQCMMACVSNKPSQGMSSTRSRPHLPPVVDDEGAGADTSLMKRPQAVLSAGGGGVWQEVSHISKIDSWD